MHTQWTDQLSGYLDGELTPAAQAALESHLQGCDVCCGVLEELRAVVAAAPGYTGAPPGDAVWQGIAAEIHARRVVPFPVPPVRQYSLGQMVAAAAVVALLAGAGTWLAVRSDAAPAAVAAGPDSVAPGAVRASASFDDPAYLAAVEELEAVLDEGRGRLDTLTVRVIEENLRVIDAAIAEARQAIAADSSNAYLGSRVQLHMQRKMFLLRQAVRATGAAT
jgi:hypothetical protein